MRSTALGNVKQISPDVITGDDKEIQLSSLGELFTVDWQERLARAGLVYSTHVGTLTAGADISMIVGGGNGTTVDSDQPELILGVDAGTFLIPIQVQVVCDVDMDADGEYGEILIFADRTQAPPTTNASGTSLTPVNLLDGGSAFAGRAWSASTADITDPVMSELLAFEYINVAEFVSNGAATNLTNGVSQRLVLNYEPRVPSILAGPCSLVVCYGGTAAVSGMAIAKFAAVPTSYRPLS